MSAVITPLSTRTLHPSTRGKIVRIARRAIAHNFVPLIEFGARRDAVRIGVASGSREYEVTRALEDSGFTVVPIEPFGQYRHAVSVSQDPRL